MTDYVSNPFGYARPTDPGTLPTNFWRVPSSTALSLFEPCQPQMRDNQLPVRPFVPQVWPRFGTTELVSWQGRQGSNLRQPVLETGTLPTELHPYREPEQRHRFAPFQA
jgi:hypothetical protein